MGGTAGFGRCRPSAPKERLQADGRLAGRARREPLGAGGGSGARHSEHPKRGAGSRAANARTLYPVGVGESEPFGVHGVPGFYISQPEFDDARMESRGFLIVHGRDLEIQVELIGEETD